MTDSTCTVPEPALHISTVPSVELLTVGLLHAVTRQAARYDVATRRLTVGIIVTAFAEACFAFRIFSEDERCKLEYKQRCFNFLVLVLVLT